MAPHFTTFVLPQAATGFDYDIPFLVLGGGTATDVAALHPPTSLHRIGHEVMPYSHASMVDELGPIPVSDAWITAVEQDYDRRAKVVLVQQPMPADIATTYAPVAKGVTDADLPPLGR